MNYGVVGRPSAATAYFRRVTRVLAAGIALVLATGLSASAGIVTNNSDSGAGSLRAVIAAAISGETITFDGAVTGTIALTTGQIIIDESLTITGPGAGVLTISGSDLSRIFLMIEGITVNISGLTFSDGAHDLAGAIDTGATLNIEDCVFSENAATEFGGGVFRNGGALTIVNSSFIDNQAVDVGGAIWSGGTLALEGVLFDGNSTTAANGSGGALWLHQGTLYTIDDCEFVDNTSGGAGAIYRLSGAMTIEGSTFTGNSSTMSSAGAVLIGGAEGDGAASISDSTFTGNTGLVGAVSAGGPGPNTIDGCTFTGNSSGAVAGVHLTIRNSTITGNTNGTAGALSLYNDCTVRNCTIADNTGVVDSPGNLYIGDGATVDIQNTLVSGGTPVNCEQDANGTLLSSHNLDTGTTCGFTGPGDIQNGTAGLGPLANNGGLTETRELLGNSHGNNGGNPLTCPATDQRGVARPYGPSCDIGAYEGLCGDGAMDPLEVCDDGNSVNGDTCDVNCTVPACGNHVVSPVEDCEDGNFDNGDCCNSTCLFETDGSPCVGDDLCTANSECDGAGSCEIAIRTTCLSAEKTGLSFSHSPGEEFKDKLGWKWSKGAMTELANFGDPESTTDYALCVFAGTSLIATLDVPVNNAAWSAAGSSGLKYKDKTGLMDGVTKIGLKAGALGKSKAKLKAKGVYMPVIPDGPLAVPVTAQLVNSTNGVCFDTSFDTADITKNTQEKFKGRTK